MTIKDLPPSATHRPLDGLDRNAEASTSSQSDHPIQTPTTTTGSDYHFYLNHDTTAPPPYDQQVGPSVQSNSDRDDLEELNPTPALLSEEGEEERQPLLPSFNASRKRKRRFKRFLFKVVMIIFVSLMTWFIAKRMNEAEDNIYVPAPLPDTKLGKIVSRASWSKPKLIESKGDSAFFSFSEFSLPVSSNLSLAFLSEGRKLQGMIAFTNVLTTPKDEILVRAELYASELEMFKTLDVSHLENQQEQIMSVLQSDGNRWKDSQVLELDLVVMFPESVRRSNKEQETASSFLASLRSEGILGFTNTENLLFGEVFINSTSDLQIRTMTSTESITLLSGGKIVSGSLLKGGSNVTLISDQSIHLEKIESPTSISVNSRGVSMITEIAAPVILSRSHDAGVSISSISVSRALEIKAANGLQCEVELLSSSSSSSSNPPSKIGASPQYPINVLATADRGFTKVTYRTQPEDVVLFSKVSTGENDVRVQHPATFQGDFRAENSKGEVIVRIPEERRSVLDVIERKKGAQKVAGRIWSESKQNNRKDGNWGESTVFNSEGILYLGFY